jgi:hypothetical protein
MEDKEKMDLEEHFKDFIEHVKIHFKERFKNLKLYVKIYFLGVLTTILILTHVNSNLKNNSKKPNDHFKDEFSKPKFEQSFSATKEVQQHSFGEVNGKELIIQGDSIRIFSFDENKQIKIEQGEKIQVPVENNNYLLDGYISEKEAIVYRALEDKDKITEQFRIYQLFDIMEDVYKELLNRKKKLSNRESVVALEDRMEALYKTFHDYIVTGEDYTIGGYKFPELQKIVQIDILKEFRSVEEMRESDTVKEETKQEQFNNKASKILKYGILKIGRK